MERITSPEERIKRAEEIYYRRKSQGVRVSTNSVNIGKSSNGSLKKKMTIQILVCAIIYIFLLLTREYNDVFSENIISKTKDILNYDIDIQKVYNQCTEYFDTNFNSIIREEQSDNVNVDATLNDELIENINENGENKEEVEEHENEGIQEDVSNMEIQENENNQVVVEQNSSIANDALTNENSINNEENVDYQQSVINDGTQKAKSDAENKTQMEADAEYIKQNFSLIQPIQGKITSPFGSREETEIISAFHQGIDISAVIGTEIHASMEGTVVSAAYAGDYGNHIKIKNGEVLTVYAHCSELEVQVGDYIEQGQEIGKVGATGKVTGPHLHFEIRRDGRYVDPELILNF